MTWNSKNTGMKYLKTGDETGHLCSECDIPMIIDKTGKGWYVYCRCCGKKVSTHDVKYTSSVSAYIWNEKKMRKTIINIL